MLTLKSSVLPIVMAGAAAVLTPSLAHADLFNVQVAGVISQSDAGATNMSSLVPVGSSLVMSFTLDSTKYIASTAAPNAARGYLIDPASFSLTAGSLSFAVDMSRPMYFALRNNDPRVDGVFLSTDANLDREFKTTVPGFLIKDGSTSTLDFNFHQTWSGGTQFSSLNIADAVGSYGVQNISVFQFDFQLPGGYIALESSIPTVTISAVPEPGEWALLVAGLGAVGLVARRRKTVG